MIGRSSLAVLTAGVMCCAPAEPAATQAMDTQIVAQWTFSGNNILELQRFLAAEMVISEACRDLCFEDGNDVGGGLFNVYVYAAGNDVSQTVELLKALERDARIPAGLRIGVARYTNEARTNWTYEPVHPDDLTSFSIM